MAGETRTTVVLQVKYADRQSRNVPYWRDFYEFEGTVEEAMPTIEEWKKDCRFAPPVRIIERIERELVAIEGKNKAA